MTCCTVLPDAGATSSKNERDEVHLASRAVGAGRRQLELSVPTIHCGGCMQRIERALAALPGVEHARVNLSTKRVSVRWHGEPPSLLTTLRDNGYDAYLCEPEDTADRTLAELVRAMAMAGFAASNIMLLSVSIWSGADPATRDLFHWLSALIALPALVYSGRVFFRSAWNCLRRGQTNMDVPISIGVLLAFSLSLYETIHRGPHAYFDAATTLLFFLLVGRTLDHMMRERARTAVRGLARLAARGALILEADGTKTYRPIDEIRPGMTVLLSAGERVPVDACVIKGRSEIDCSLVNGESRPQAVTEGTLLQAGTMNLTGPLTVRATAAADDSFLAEMMRMMEAAEQGRSVHRRIADRAARLYAPVVHLTALLTFAGWMMVTGNAHHAITVAIAVLIITCPCALGLAVPMVQVTAAWRLFEHGIMVKDGGALERMAEIDTVLFDKTGTLTLGRPWLVEQDAIDPGTLAIAAAIASHSRHPYSLALAAAHRNPGLTFDSVSEHPGDGLEAHAGSTTYRLGRAAWAQTNGQQPAPAKAPNVVLSRDGQLLAAFHFDDQLRPGAQEAVAALRATAMSVEVLSGDRKNAVQKAVAPLGIPWAAELSPAGKVDHIVAATAAGRKVLMVGDGLNDAPALVCAHASMAPASAADVGRNAADLVFLRENLMAVPEAIATARDASRLIRQNLIFSVAYNAVAVPIAILGQVTPLIAAIAMSASSVLVIANSLRLRSIGGATTISDKHPESHGAPAARPA